MEVYVDDETKLTLHGLQQYYVKLKDNEKNRKLFDLLDVLEFNQVFKLSFFTWKQEIADFREMCNLLGNVLSGMYSHLFYNMYSTAQR